MRNEVRLGVEKQNLWCTAQSTLLYLIFVCCIWFIWKPSECLKLYFFLSFFSKHTPCLPLVGQKHNPVPNSAQCRSGSSNKECLDSTTQYKGFKIGWRYYVNIIIIIIIPYIYIALFLGTQSALHKKVHHHCAASTWMMRRQPYCTRTPITHQLTGEETVMKPISVWGWLGGHDGQRPMGKFGQDYTPTLFRRTSWDF